MRRTIQGYESAIEQAKQYGSSQFVDSDVMYVIQQNKGYFFQVMAFYNGHCVGGIGTSGNENHDGIYINENYRHNGIASVLFRTKQALDGILEYEYSNKRTHIFFMLKQGYIPVARVVNDQEIPLSFWEKLICHEILHGPEETTSDFVLKYSPICASLVGLIYRHKDQKIQ